MSTLVQSALQRQYSQPRPTEGPEPGVWDTLGASINSTVDRVPHVQETRLREAYAVLTGTLRELNGAGYLRYNNVLRSLAGDHFDERAIWGDIAEARARYPERFKDVPTSQAEFEKKVLSRDGRADRDVRTAARGSTIANLAGGMIGAMRDPRNLAAMLISGGGSSFWAAVSREAGINMAVELAQTPENIVAARRLGDDPGAREVAANVLLAGLGAAAFTAAGRGIAVGGRALADPITSRIEKVITENWDDLPQAVRDKWGSVSKMDDRALPDIFEARVGRENMSVDERAALAVLRREAEIDAANPFRGGLEGNDAHRTLLARNMRLVEEEIAGIKRRAAFDARAALGGGPVLSRGDTAISSGVVRVPGRPGKVGYANDVYQYFRAKGLSDAQARGIAAGIHAESRSDHNIRGGYKRRAVGLGQWLGPRRAKLLARYGENPTRQQQLDFLWEELNGGDAGGRAVLSAGDERAVLDAYIRKFMRPAAGAETVGDLKRGMQALGRGGEDIAVGDRPAMRGVGDAIDDEMADLARRRAGLDADRAAFDAERAARLADASDEVDLGAMRLWDDGAGEFVDELEIAPMAELRRDLFPDETSWRIAQAAYEAAELGLDAPAMTRQSVWIEARDGLLAAQEGEVPNALFHRDVGPIDVKYGAPPAQGKEGYGLAKIAEKHPEVMDDLPALLDEMEIKSRTDNRVVLESPDHKAVVRLEWDGQAQTWLLSAYQRKGKAPPRRTTDVPGKIARDGSPTREAGTNIGDRAARGKDGPIDVEAAAATRGWDDARDTAATEQMDSLIHDLDVRHGPDGEELAVYLGDEGEAVSWAKLREELAQEESEIANIRGCL